MDIQKVFNPLTGRMVNAGGSTDKSVKQKKQKVSVLEAVIKRKLTKKPEPPKPAPKPAPIKFGFEDLDDGVKDIISKYVKKNKSGFDEDGRDVSNFRQGFLRINDYITYVNQVLEDTNVSHKVRVKLRKEAIQNIKDGEKNEYISSVSVEVYDFNRKMKAFIKKTYKKKNGENLIISDLGTKSLFIVPDYANEFYYDMSGGYGGDEYTVLDDGKYISEEDENQRLANQEGYENDKGLKIKLFGNPNIIAKLKEDKSGGGKWIIPKYDKYVLTKTEYEVMVGEWFADSSLKKNERKVVSSIPTQDSDSE